MKGGSRRFGLHDQVGHFALTMSGVVLVFLFGAVAWQSLHALTLQAPDEMYLFRSEQGSTVSFEENLGQFPDPIRFVLRAKRSAASFEDGRIVYRIGDVTFRQSFDGSKVQAVYGQMPLAQTSNYYIGASADDWHTGVRHYSLLQYSRLYPGIDAEF